MYTGMERSICLSRLRDLKFPTDWNAVVGASFPSLKDLICTMLSVKPCSRPSADAVVQAIQSILAEFTILSLDNEHGPEMILLRVEAEHREDALAHTIKLIQTATESCPVNIVQYGLRSSSVGERPTAIMEFAVKSNEPKSQGAELVRRLSERPEIHKVRQVSRSSSSQ